MLFFLLVDVPSQATPTLPVEEVQGDQMLSEAKAKFEKIQAAKCTHTHIPTHTCMQKLY